MPQITKVELNDLYLPAEYFIEILIAITFVHGLEFQLYQKLFLILIS